MTVVGWVLITGFMAFMVGAGGWRLEYERPPEDSLSTMHSDRGRLRWIHWWMISAMVTTVAGLFGLAATINDVWVWVAVSAYATGAVLWIVNLSFRLTVGEWAAEVTARTGSVPEMYPPLAGWMGQGHGIHMGTAYAAAIPLAWALAGRNVIPVWLGVAGALWGLVLGTMLLVPKTRFVAAPPFWAHAFTLAIGIALLQ